MSKGRDRVEIRSSIAVEDTILTNTLHYMEDKLIHSYRDICNIEDYIPRELAIFVEELMSLDKL
jgi:hypothetical protein